MISKAYAARQSHVYFANPLIPRGNIGFDRKVPAVVLVCASAFLSSLLENDWKALALLAVRPQLFFSQRVIAWDEYKGCAS
jgi:hypothetical protein